jgi:beta-glucosidase
METGCRSNINTSGYSRTGRKNVTVEFSEEGDFGTSTTRADIGIAVVGEKPYAEGWGDKAYPVLDTHDLEAIKKLQATCNTVVVIIISGRPLLVTNEIASWDAVVAGWLPGSEGQGVADVLFGDKPFTGTLPLPWPHHSNSYQLQRKERQKDGTAVLFPRGMV